MPRRGERAVVSLAVLLTALIVAGGANDGIAASAGRWLSGVASELVRPAAPRPLRVPAPAAAPSPTPAPTAPERRLTIALREVNESDVVGSATLIGRGDATTLVLLLIGPAARFPVHLHTGPCDRPATAPVVPLADAAVGRVSTTALGLPLRDLLAGRYAITVHAPATSLDALLDPRTHIACGELGLRPASPPAAVPERVPEGPTVTGTGMVPSGVGTTAPGTGSAPGGWPAVALLAVSAGACLVAAGRGRLRGVAVGRRRGAEGALPR